METATTSEALDRLDRGGGPAANRYRGGFAATQPLARVLAAVGGYAPRGHAIFLVDRKREGGPGGRDRGRG